MGFLIVFMALINVAAFIWLAVKAFRKSIGWGFAVLFVPFVAVIYTVKNWQEAKKPFLAYIGSAVAIGLVVGFYMAGSVTARGASASNPGIASPDAPQGGALTPEQKISLDLTEKGLDLMEKLPQNEKSKITIAVMRGYIRHKKSGSTHAQRMELKGEMMTMLQRSDLTPKERQSVENMLRDLEQTSAGAVPIHSQNPPPVKKEEALPSDVKSTTAKSTPLPL